MGATADLLREMDEAQDVDEEKYRRDFRPMASTTNALTVLYGTAWSDDCLLEKQRQSNIEEDGVDHDLDPIAAVLFSSLSLHRREPALPRAGVVQHGSGRDAEWCAASAGTPGRAADPTSRLSQA
jgi:hypothetical protein